MTQQPPAAYRPRAGASARRATEPFDIDGFDYQLGMIAHRLRNSLPDLDDAEKRLLEDYARGASANGEARYRMISFRRLCAVARRSRTPELREALAELVRSEVLSGAEPTSVEVAFDHECAAVGPADVAQRMFEQRPDVLTLAKCKEALLRQLATTRQALDALSNWKMGGATWR